MDNIGRQTLGRREDSLHVAGFNFVFDFYLNFFLSSSNWAYLFCLIFSLLSGVSLLHAIRDFFLNGLLSVL